MTTSNDNVVKILTILGPFVGLFPNLMTRKLNEIAVKMDENWKIFAITSYFTNRISLPCLFELHTTSMFGSPKSVLTRIMYLLSCIFKGANLVKKEKIHVVTQHDGHLEYGMVAYAVSRLTHRKCLIRVNEDTLIPLIFFLKSSGNYLFKSKTVLRMVALVYRSIERVFFKHVDWTVTHGPMDCEKIRKVTDRITFVPLWVDTEKFRRLSKDATKKLREKFTSSKDVKLLLFVGRLHPEKGVQTLLEALKIMQDKDVLLMMVYSISEYKEKYEQLVEKLGISDKICFVSYVPHEDLPRYYSVADLYVLPSMREEWSNTIMEAMACETPVVATEVGGNPYLIVEGETGFLVSPNDSSGLAEKMLFVLENPSLVKRVTETAANEIKKYDKEVIGDLYKSVVKNLVKDSNRLQKKGRQATIK
jgi:glycosyltransferase involved in cell wall biosynthesis